MITILTTCLEKGKKPVLTKRYTHGEDGSLTKTDYDLATFFDVLEFPADTIGELSAILTELESDIHRCIIRAEPTGAREHIRRRIKSDDSTMPPLRDAARGRKWLMLDFDKLPNPGLVTNEERLAHLVSQLPEEFHDASYHYQWSCSAGRDGWETLSCHLWYMLDRPWLCRTLFERFYEGDFRDVPVDPAPFTSNQIHYTARPIFENCVDPLISRSGLVLCNHNEVTLRPLVRPVVQRQIVDSAEQYKTHGLKRYYELLGEIGLHYHRPILRAVAHYCAVVPFAEFDEDFLTESLRSAIDSTTATRKREYLNRRYLDRVIKGGRRRYGARY